jgi:hypothetical protein
MRPYFTSIQREGERDKERKKLPKNDKSEKSSPGAMFYETASPCLANRSAFTFVAFTNTKQRQSYTVHDLETLKDGTGQQQ